MMISGNRKEMEWSKIDYERFSTYVSGDWTIEPEDTNSDSWLLWLKGNLMLEGTRQECMNHASMRD